MTRLRLALLSLLLAVAALAIELPGSGAATTVTTDDSSVPACTSSTTGSHAVRPAADAASAGTIGFSQPSYTANENAGQYWITVTRTDTSGSDFFFYGVNMKSAQSPWDFHVVSGTKAILAPGQASCRFPVTIVDNGMHGPSVQASAWLSASSPAKLPADPDKATLTILRNDPLAKRDAANPLDLSPAPTNGDPLSGAQFYVAPAAETAAGQAMASDQAAGDTAGAAALRFIAQQPFAYRFDFYNTQRNTAEDVAHYLELARDRQPGRVIELSTYTLVHGARGSTANAAFTAKYLHWIHNVARGIGNFRVVFLLEGDSLLQAPRLTPAERHVRLVEQLKPAIKILEQDPHVAVYLDAGSSDGLKASRAANYLRQAGISNAQGFYLNSTHFNWDTVEIRQGQKISKLLGGSHFLISSGVNGRGPLLLGRGRNRPEQLCNPVGRGLGTMSTQTGYTDLDGLLWFAPVGNSAGACRAGAPPSPDYWPAYAVSLYARRQFGVTGPRLALKRDGKYVPYDSAFAG